MGESTGEGGCERPETVRGEEERQMEREHFACECTHAACFLAIIHHLSFVL